MGDGTPEVDPVRFGDPLAERTSWEPMAEGIHLFNALRLIETAPGRFEAKLASTTLRLWAFFGFLALTLLIGQLVRATVGSIHNVGAILVILALAAVAPIVIVRAIGKRLPARFVIDRASGRCWHGEGQTSARQQVGIPLATIHAIQLLVEHVRSHSQKGTRYELNLVQKDGQRIHVLHHHTGRFLREDAEKLAQALGCRVWDASRRPHPDAAFLLLVGGIMLAACGILFAGVAESKQVSQWFGALLTPVGVLLVVLGVRSAWRSWRGAQ